MAVYCLISLIFSLISFTVFRVQGAIPRYLSVEDLMDLAKAVFLGEMMTGIVLFSFTRLDGVPRSTPAIHALILGTGLIAVRALVHLADGRRRLKERPRRVARDHVILIGMNDMSVILMKFLEASATDHRRVIALLDEDPRWIGRSVRRVRVFGPPAHLDALIEEFAIHGVKTDRVVIGCETEKLSTEVLKGIRSVCAQRDVELVFISDLLSMSRAKDTVDAFQVAPIRGSASDLATAADVSRYFHIKRPIGCVAALAMVIALLPLWILAAMLAMIDVGSPVVFWQRRVGQGGHHFHLYKFRTLRSSFDRHGDRIPEELRLSGIGRLLRRTRLDELPQLLNVLAGEMSLIGPRPLLAKDQPENPYLRLMIRPGITGWAQVNGGALLSATEKEVLDGWYVRNASPWVDLRIVAMTFLSLTRGDRRSKQADMQAQRGHYLAAVESKNGGPRLAAWSRLADLARNGRRKHIERRDGIMVARLSGAADRRRDIARDGVAIARAANRHDAGPEKPSDVSAGGPA